MKVISVLINGAQLEKKNIAEGRSEKVGQGSMTGVSSVRKQGPSKTILDPIGIT